MEDQDRSLWNREMIREGVSLVEQAIAARPIGPYAIQSAIATVHAEAPNAGATDWEEIVGLYDLLLRIEPSPVVELNRAAAIAMHRGPSAGLDIINAILSRGDLTGYHLAYSAQADLCRRLGRMQEARESYAAALKLARLEPERRYESLR